MPSLNELQVQYDKEKTLNPKGVKTMPITSGSIEYERRLNLGEYNHKNIVAKVSWVAEPNEDDEVLANQAIQKALSRVAAVLNCVVNMEGKPTLNLVFPDAEPLTDVEKHNVQTALAKPVPIVESIENIAAPNLAAQHPAAEITAGIPPALKRHRRTKVEMAAAEARHAAQMEAARALEAEVARESEDIAEPGMPSFDPDPAPPAEVTDEDLTNACEAKASSGTPSAAIKALVTKFSPDRLIHTPQGARRRFLDELAKL